MADNIRQVAQMAATAFTPVQAAINELNGLVDSIRAEKDRNIEEYRRNKNNIDSDLLQIIEAADSIGKTATVIRSELVDDALCCEVIQCEAPRPRGY
jgi:hypothetical protein